MTALKYWQAVNTAMREEMERDPKVILFGEDVAAPGGSFGASKGLLDAFGPERVRDTPISEATIVGTALGAAMTGYRPIVEIMFFDFVAVAMDQIVNQAAKISYMSAGGYAAPMVIRTICAAGRRTGPQHSQNLEVLFAHIPGLKVVWGSTPADVRGLLKAAIRDDAPVLAIESLVEWSSRGEVDEADGIVPIGSAAVRTQGDDITVLSWGGAAPKTVRALEELGDVSVELIDLRTISPWDRATVLASVEKTGRLLIVHDAVVDFGVGAEIAATVGKELFGRLRAPIERLGALSAPAPFAPHLEDAYLPQPSDIAAAVRDIVRPSDNT
ncbi:alpha-ketoacid dehydrogenase subunit beta [Cryobacterium sp. TMS1-20-1]|uniref:alpha-ketoacid dehydrogenase subunit beta n=1 Tax=Cryobacterium sp. TMS1-20-1 TaxID=1259223 RepID=UPI00106AD892|nr:alpha-ketoacid dehydrogenase subunit beta [Cryobacterium sp. TMS1-20-1]TFC78898.1 alpha-ketoacid dehydrogenase subunit beta [Cryobacterium sp. TMS1-20-1]